MIRIYLVGVLVLLGAILANFLASIIKCKTWYTLIHGMIENPFFFKEIKLQDCLWLFLLYPFLLGLSAYVGNLLHQKLF